MIPYLHTYSYFSLLEGLAAPQELAQIAAGFQLPALALTDRRRLTGSIEFYESCCMVGVQPILGLEIEVDSPLGPISAGQGIKTLPSGPLVLLAMDATGWANLCRLSSILLDTPEAVERDTLPFSLLSEHSAGLVCLSGGRRSLFDRWVRRHREHPAKRWLQLASEVFPGRLYIELQILQPGDLRIASHLERIAGQMNLPLCASHTVYMGHAGQAELQQVVTAIRLNCTIDEIPPQEVAPPGASFLPPDEMATRFAKFPQALDGAREIAARCQFEMPLDKPNYPRIELPPGEKPIDRLRQKAYHGAQKEYGELTPEITNRLEHELDLIAEKDYASLFLIMEDVLAFARQADIPTASRGSASSSLVAHCLGVTTPDPLRHNLYFERFLNPARSSPPDIDTDICSRGRDRVINYVYETYGRERVAMVGTINRFRRRSALRETAKAFGLSSAEITQLVKTLPRRHWHGPDRAPSVQGTSPFDRLKERYRGARYQAIFRNAQALLGKPHHLSVHAGGVIITPVPMHDLLPTQLASKGIRITQFDLEAVERLGLVKLDLLGIRGLSVLGDVATAVQAAKPEHYPTRLAALAAIPQDDAATANLVRKGQTVGCFQIESPGMRATLQEISANSVDDILAALALYRPGPLTGGLKDAFVRRHLGQEPVTYLHPKLAPLLKETYGVILYQEQVLRIAHELGGLSMAEADTLRRAMSHFDPGKQMDTLKARFIAGALAKAGIPRSTAEKVWELMSAFAGYGFPKAHAASYAQIAWRSAWCKAHFPAEFIAAVLANWGGYYSQRVYLAEARRMGLALKAPHVNYSQHAFSVAAYQGVPTLFMGLGQVRELTRRTRRRILRARPFHNLRDFLERVDPRPQEAENLVKVGAFHGLGETIPALLTQLKAARGQPGQLSLFTLEAGRESEEWSQAQKAAAQEAILGVSVDFHPLELAQDAISGQTALNTLDAATRFGQKVRVAGVRASWQRISLDDGAFAYIMQFEDLHGSLQALIPVFVYRKYKSTLSTMDPLVLEGEMIPGEDGGEALMRVQHAWRL